MADNFLVRVGSRSESEKLKKWNLRAIAKNYFGSNEDFQEARYRVDRLSHILKELQFHLRETVSGISED